MLSFVIPARGDAPASPTKSPCTVPTDIEPADAFGSPVSDLRTLSFIAIEERLAPELQADVAKKASATPNVYVAAPIDAKLQDACVLSEIRTRQMRLLYAILERWPKVDPNRLEPAARYAIAALFFGDSLPPATRDAALAVFDTNVEQIDNLIDARQTVATH